MAVKIYWRDGGQSKWSATFLSFADGYLLEYEHLHTDDMAELGVRISRGYHSTDQSDEEAHLICEEKVIVKPDELKNVLAVSQDGAIKLLYNPETDQLDDKTMQELLALIYATSSDAAVEQEQEPLGVEDVSLVPDGAERLEEGDGR